MKNLNIKLAENFKFDWYTSIMYDFDFILSDDEKDLLCSFVFDNFLTNLAKKGVFPENSEIIRIDLPREIYLDKHKDITHIDIDLEETGIIYNFNENFELKIIEIEGATIY